AVRGWFRLHGQRPDHGPPDRYCDVAAAPWSRAAAAALGRSRSVAGDEGGEGMTEEIRPEGCRCEEALEHLYEYLAAEMCEIQLGGLRAHIEESATCLDAISRERELRIVLSRSCADVAPDTLRMRVRTQLTLLRQSRTR